LGQPGGHLARPHLPGQSRDHRSTGGCCITYPCETLETHRATHDGFTRAPNP
jgi:hypothetical protein